MSLNRGQFRIEDLVQCYAPPNLLSVMPGNKVMLRSGGPEMTVADVEADGRALCQWIDGAGKLNSALFDLRMLTCYGAK